MTPKKEKKNKSNKGNNEINHGHNILSGIYTSHDFDDTSVSPNHFNDIEKEIGTYTKVNKDLRESAQSNFEKMRDDLEEVRKEVRGQIDSFEKVVKENQKYLEEKSDEQKVRVIEVLGIFISLFTFISVDIQIFRDNNNPLILSGFILIMLGGLALFNLLIKLLIDKQLSLTKSITLPGFSNIFKLQLEGRTKTIYPDFRKPFETLSMGFVLVLIIATLLGCGIILVIAGTFVDFNKSTSKNSDTVQPPYTIHNEINLPASFPKI